MTSYLHNVTNVVILDHGIYKQLSEDFRKNYCHLWEALILLDSQKIQQLGETFGVGKYAQYFPVIFTGRTINRWLSFALFQVWMNSMNTEKRKCMKRTPWSFDSSNKINESFLEPFGIWSWHFDNETRTLYLYVQF